MVADADVRGTRGGYGWFLPFCARRRLRRRAALGGGGPGVPGGIIVCNGGSVVFVARFIQGLASLEDN